MSHVCFVVAADDRVVFDWACACVRARTCDVRHARVCQCVRVCVLLRVVRALSYEL